ncbi:hypothetical protein [Sagittula sp. SSi028]|uniref:hypothetical protein n=1 Tax=Sagittula sp. SSi028 TaxID=3400636 RepID=UPI003AF71571
MKLAKIAAIALLASAPITASAQEADPFTSSTGSELLPLFIIGGAASIIAITAGSSDSDSSDGTED